MPRPVSSQKPVPPPCPLCGADNSTHNGSANGLPKFRCRSCGKSFQGTTPQLTALPDDDPTGFYAAAIHARRGARSTQRPRYLIADENKNWLMVSELPDGFCLEVRPDGSVEPKCLVRIKRKEPTP